MGGIHEHSGILIIKCSCGFQCAGGGVIIPVGISASGKKSVKRKELNDNLLGSFHAVLKEMSSHITDIIKRFVDYTSSVCNSM